MFSPLRPSYLSLSEWPWNWQTDLLTFYLGIERTLKLTNYGSWQTKRNKQGTESHAALSGLQSIHPSIHPCEDVLLLNINFKSVESIESTFSNQFSSCWFTADCFVSINTWIDWQRTGAKSKSKSIHSFNLSSIRPSIHFYNWSNHLYKVYAIQVQKYKSTLTHCICIPVNEPPL